MKKIVFVLLLALAASVFAFDAPQGFYEYTLPNSMRVFVFEDFSMPLVRIEYRAKIAAGFYPDFSEFKSEFKTEENNELQSTTARIVVECVESEAQEIFERLSSAAFSNAPKQISKEKILIENTEPMNLEEFINSAIDFYTGDFHAEEIRASDFGAMQNSSTPQLQPQPENSALFVSGAISKDRAIQLAQNSFGAYPSKNAQTPSLKWASPKSGAAQTATVEQNKNKPRKFVLSDARFSADIAQIAMQYNSLSQTQSDIAAEILNAASLHKAALAQGVNIRSADYINAASVRKNKKRRLVIQAILEDDTEENDDNKNEPNFLEQAILFEKSALEKTAEISKSDFDAAKLSLEQKFEEAFASSADLMKTLSQFWATVPEACDETGNKNSDFYKTDESVFKRFLRQKEIIAQSGFEPLKAALKEEPIFFVFLNSNYVSNNKEKILQAGFEIVSEEGFRKTLLQQQSNDFGFDGASGFIQKSREAIHSARLANNMRVTVKTDMNKTSAALALVIHTTSNENEEFQSSENEFQKNAILASLIAKNIEKNAAKKFSAKKISKLPACEVSVLDTAAVVTTDFASRDTDEILECAASALFHNEFRASDIDEFLLQRRREKSIKAASLSRQLYAAGIEYFYESDFYKAHFSDAGEILEGLTHNEMLIAAQKILNANNIEIIASGALDEKKFAQSVERHFSAFKSKAEKSNSSLASPPSRAAMEAAFENNAFQAKQKNNSLKTKLPHRRFFVEAASGAKPRQPSALVPTSEFNDPVQYWLASPSAADENAVIFDALMLELERLCKENAAAFPNAKMNAQLEEKNALVAFGAITIFGAESVSQADRLFEAALAALRQELQDANANLERIKSLWTKKFYKDALKNSTAIKIIARKIEAERLAAIETRPDTFTKDYEILLAAGLKEFGKVLETNFAEHFKIYSSDSKP